MDTSEQLFGILDEDLNENLKQIVISNPRSKEQATKISVRPVLLGDALLFQVSSYVGKQVFHENLSKEEVLAKCQTLKEEYKQFQIIHRDETVTALISKKGKLSISKKNIKTVVPKDISHNRGKKYILEEGKAVPFLVDLGVMTAEGKVVSKRYHKFRQINRFLELVSDVAGNLPKDRRITVLDFGCGKSYLTFALYYYLHELKSMDVDMIGLDLKVDVIDKCNELAKKYGYSDLHFLSGDIKDYQDKDSVDMVVTLHACDVATDYALHKAIMWNAKVIMSVPCCQHELNEKLDRRCKEAGASVAKSDDIVSCEAVDKSGTALTSIDSMLQFGIIKERFAALATDAYRAEILKSRGYDANVIEFIDIEDTPKNLLIRAVKKNSGASVASNNQNVESGSAELESQYDRQFSEFKAFLGETLTLERLLAEEK